MNKPVELLCQIDSGIIPTFDIEWTITSPNATVWGATIDTNGIVTLTSGVAVLNTPSVLSMSGYSSTLTISNGGIITTTGPSALLTAADLVAALADSNSTTWVFVQRLDDQLSITSDFSLENKFYYPAIIISFEVTQSNDVFHLYAIKPNTTRHRR